MGLPGQYKHVTTSRYYPDSTVAGYSIRVNRSSEKDIFWYPRCSLFWVVSVHTGELVDAHALAADSEPSISSRAGLLYPQPE